MTPSPHADKGSLTLPTTPPSPARFIKGLGEEFNRVTWPTPTQLLGQTLVVMLVVGLMTLFIWGVDSLWRWGIAAITP